MGLSCLLRWPGQLRLFVQKKRQVVLDLSPKSQMIIRQGGGAPAGAETGQFRGQVRWLFQRGKMACILNDFQPGPGHQITHLFMLGWRAPGILPANHQQGGDIYLAGYRLRHPGGLSAH